MSIPTFHQGELKRAWGGWPSALLSVVAALAAAAAVVVFFWPNDIGPGVRATLQYVGAGQQQTTSGIKAINDSLAAEHKAINDSLAAERRDLKTLSDQFLAQTRGKRAINDSPAAEELAPRLTALQNATTRILRDNAEIAERLKETQAQMAQDNASVAEQLKALTQMARDNAEKRGGSREHVAGAFAKDSDESLRPQTPLTRQSTTSAIQKRRKNVMRNWF